MTVSAPARKEGLVTEPYNKPPGFSLQIVNIHASWRGGELFNSHGGLNENSTTRGSDVWMLCHYWRRIRRCGLVGGSMSLGVDFEVSKAHAKPRLSLSVITGPYKDHLCTRELSFTPWNMKPEFLIAGYLDLSYLKFPI